MVTDKPSSPLQVLVLAAPALILLLLFFLVPALMLGRVSLYEGGNRSGFGIGGSFYQPGTWSLQAYRALLTDGYFRSILAFTIKFGVAVALATVVIAYPMAFLISRLPGRWKLAAVAVVTLPKLANVLVVIYGLKLLMGTTGLVNQLLQVLGLSTSPVELLHNLTGTMVGETYLILPYAVLILIVALDRIDPSLAQAARGLGAGPWRTFWRVTFPLSLPGVALVFFLSLIFALGAFVSPYLMGSPEQLTLAVDVQRQTFENLNWPRGAAEAVIMLFTLIVIALVWQALTITLKRTRRET
ncbi:MAG TPA: ABC transporter permease [Blastocatellia bacterium]|nr:ABC transporter permease [Blastocatellia bacterium]